MVREVETLTLLLTGEVLTLALLKCLLDTVLRTSLQGNTDFTSLLVTWLQNLLSQLHKHSGHKWFYGSGQYGNSPNHSNSQASRIVTFCSQKHFPFLNELVSAVIIASKFTKVRHYKAIVCIAQNHAVRSFVIVTLCTCKLEGLSSNMLSIKSTFYMWHIPSFKGTIR